MKRFRYKIGGKTVTWYTYKNQIFIGRNCHMKALAACGADHPHQIKKTKPSFLG